MPPLFQGHRITEVTLFISHTTAIEADKLRVLHQLLNLFDLPCGRQHTEVTGMSMLMFTVFSFIGHNSAPFWFL